MPRKKKIEEVAAPAVTPEVTPAAPAAQEAPAQAAVFDPKAPVEVPLDPHDATLAQLGGERIQNAQLHLQNRKNEFDALLTQIRAKYEENGKYTMTSIDLGRGTIVRALR